MSGTLDYDSDKDPLGYMTSDYRSPCLVESGMDMERRFFVRAKSAPHLWQRVLVRLMIVVPVGVIAVILVVGATQVISHLVGR